MMELSFLPSLGGFLEQKELRTTGFISRNHYDEFIHLQWMSEMLHNQDRISPLACLLHRDGSLFVSYYIRATRFSLKKSYLTYPFTVKYLFTSANRFCILCVCIIFSYPISFQKECQVLDRV